MATGSYARRTDPSDDKEGSKTSLPRIRERSPIRGATRNIDVGPSLTSQEEASFSAFIEDDESEESNRLRVASRVSSNRYSRRPAVYRISPKDDSPKDNHKPIIIFLRVAIPIPMAYFINQLPPFQGAQLYVWLALFILTGITFLIEFPKGRELTLNLLVMPVIPFLLLYIGIRTVITWAKDRKNKEWVLLISNIIIILISLSILFISNAIISPTKTLPTSSGLPYNINITPPDHTYEEPLPATSDHTYKEPLPATPKQTPTVDPVSSATHTNR